MDENEGLFLLCSDLPGLIGEGLLGCQIDAFHATPFLKPRFL